MKEKISINEYLNLSYKEKRNYKPRAFKNLDLGYTLKGEKISIETYLSLPKLKRLDYFFVAPTLKSKHFGFFRKKL